MKHAGRLTAKAVHDLIMAGATGKHGDGQGVWLQIGGPGRASWLMRYTSPATGKAREMGLGAAAVASLADAAGSLQTVRDKGAQARELLRQGIDPLQARKAALAPAPAAPAGPPRSDRRRRTTSPLTAPAGATRSMPNSGRARSRGMPIRGSASTPSAASSPTTCWGC